MKNVNWNDLENAILNFQIIEAEKAMNDVPHKFFGDASGWTISECLKWINDENSTPIKSGLYPIYGTYNSYDYQEDCAFLLIEPSTGKFYEISGSQCSCYGFEEQFVPEECPLEYIQKGKKWDCAFELVLEVIRFFKDKQN